MRGQRTPSTGQGNLVRRPLEPESLCYAHKTDLQWGSSRLLVLIPLHPQAELVGWCVRKLGIYIERRGGLVRRRQPVTHFSNTRLVVYIRCIYTTYYNFMLYIVLDIYSIINNVEFYDCFRKIILMQYILYIYIVAVRIWVLNSESTSRSQA